MRIFVFLLLCSITISSSYAQDRKTAKLKTWMAVHPGEYFPVRIEFKDNVDCYLLNQQFKSDKTPSISIQIASFASYFPIDLAKS